MLRGSKAARPIDVVFHIIRDKGPISMQAVRSEARHWRPYASPTNTQYYIDRLSEFGAIKWTANGYIVNEPAKRRGK